MLHNVVLTLLLGTKSVLDKTFISIPQAVPWEHYNAVHHDLSDAALQFSQKLSQMIKGYKEADAKFFINSFVEMPECRGCGELSEKDFIFHTLCGYAVCADCLNRRFRNPAVEFEGVATVKCYQCSVEYDLDLVKVVVDSEIYHRYTAMLAEWDAYLKGGTYCSDRRCACLLSKDDESNGPFLHCPKCYKLTCPTCKQPAAAHKLLELHCPEVPEDAELAQIRRLVRGRELGLFECPHCKMIWFREDRPDDPYLTRKNGMSMR